jgi:hypothetical protein
MMSFVQFRITRLGPLDLYFLDEAEPLLDGGQSGARSLLSKIIFTATRQ